MRLRLTCKSCGTAFAVDAKHAGKTGRCPNAACRAAVRVPLVKPADDDLDDFTTPAAPPRRTGGLPPRAGSAPRAAARPAARRKIVSPIAVGAALFLVVAVVVGFEAFGPGGVGDPVVVPANGGLLMAAAVSAEPTPAKPAEPTAAQVVHVSKSQDEEFHGKVVPFLKKYCNDCHAGDTAEADVNFEAYGSVASLFDQRRKWNGIRGIIDIGAMPPADHDPQPSMEERREIADWLDKTLNQVDCALVDDPGRVTIRRLNRVEYDNTIRDLVGVDFKPAADFPSDDVGNGFDNQGDVLSLSPLLLEKYLDAAEQIAEKAIVTNPDKLLTRRAKGGSLPSSSDDIDRKFRFTPGEYILRAEVQAEQAGDEVAKAEFRFAGKPLRKFGVQGESQPHVFEVTVTIGPDEAGEHVFAVGFLNDFYDPKAKNPRRRDRNLEVNWLEVTGPKGGEPDWPESHRRLIVARPTKEKSVRQAAEEVFAPFVTRAYRRPADPVEVNRVVNLVETAVRQGETYEQAVAFGVQAVLVSPHFLFRVEEEVRTAAATKQPVDQFDLAARLSYFLWSTTPDADLFDLAARGELSKPETLSAQVRRMLADPKSEALVKNFFGQWLNLRNLDEIEPDPRRYRWWNSALREAMRKETELFCAAIVKEDRSVLDVLDADFTFVNPRLAELYGVQWDGKDPKELYYAYKGSRNDGDYEGNKRSGLYDREEEFVRVSLPANRRGVLTQASVLTLTSNPAETSPVKRGQWILANLLGTPPPPAPPNVPGFEEAKKAKPDATLREQLALHREDPSCASCHNVMDPLGLGFENFDVIGRWRDKDGDHPVDPSGQLADGTKFQGPAELIEILKRREGDIARHFVEKLATYGLGRGLEYYDRCAVDEAVAAAAKDDYKFSSVVTAIVLSDPFRMRNANTSNDANTSNGERP